MCLRHGAPGASVGPKCPTPSLRCGYHGRMPIEGRGLFALLAVCMPMAACAQPAPPPRSPGPPPPQAAVALPPPIPDYVPSPKAQGQWATLLPRQPGDDGGVLIAGARATLSGTVASDAGGDPLVAGLRIRAPWGGGFLFWSHHALYRAQTFLGELELIAPLYTQVKTVSYGPGFLLVRTTEGQRMALYGTSRTVGPPSPLGLLDVAALPMGPAVALLEDGRVTVSLDQGASWKDVTDLDAEPMALSVIDDDVWLKLANGEARRLERDGTWSARRSAPPDTSRIDPGPCGAEFPTATVLTAAIRDGLPIHGDIALAPLDGALLRVDLRNGHCLSAPRRIAPSRSRCELVVTPTGAISICTVESNGAIVFTGILDDDGTPKQEASFEGNVWFHEAAGHVLADGPCTGSERTAGVVCLRNDDGTWVELDRRDDALGGWLPRWIPRDDGGALGIATEPEPVWIDARSGKRTPLKNIKPETLRSLLGSRPRTVIDRQWHVAVDNTVHGWSADKHLVLHADKGLTTSPFELSTMATFGTLAFGFDRSGHAWQTLDDGRNWLEVLAPPSRVPQSPPRATACSLVGCDLQGWLRVGWRTTPPEPRAATPTPEPLPAPVSRRPNLSCRRTGPAQFLSFPVPEGTERETPMSGFGARVVPESRGDVQFSGASFVLGTGPFPGADADLGLRAFSHQRDLSGEGAAPAGIKRTVWFTQPFDPTMKISTAGFALRDIAASAPGSVELEGWLEASDDGAVVPVMGEKAGATAGWILQADGTRPLLWVGADGPAKGRSYAMGLEDDQREPMSAAVRGADELLVLARDGSCSTSVSALRPRSSQRLFALPTPPTNVGCGPNRDVLALGPNGEVGVIRTPSGAEPATANDPALLLLPGRPMLPLAPWATLLPASAAACKQDHAGYRAILVTKASWLGMTEGNGAIPVTAGMMAMVRWSTTRVCLEGVEIDGGNWDPGQDLMTTVVARFDDTPAAGRIGVTRGMELRLPMECTLPPP